MGSADNTTADRSADVIPIERGPRSQLVNAVGMFLFLVSWGITFVGMFVAYTILRLRAHEWPPSGTPPLPRLLPSINTVIALVSSITFDRAVIAARQARPAHVRRWMLITGLLGSLFLVLQNVVWTRLWASGLRLRVSNFAGLYYAFTWFHAAHVAAGLLILLALVPRALRSRFTPREHGPLRFGAWFWHFVTGVWFGVFFAFYVI